MGKVKVIVKPGCKKSEILFEDNCYKVFLKSMAEKGEANKELVRIMGKFLKKKVRIVSGFRSRIKYLEVS